jgi:spore coat polysaccharide biosynthesis protein SpsF
MEKLKEIGIVIQARMGSTRLPGKMGKQFANDMSLLAVVLNNFSSFSKDFPVIIATSTARQDDAISEIGQKAGFQVYRGSENDVLQRFIGAAEANKISAIVRICADNPFILEEYIHLLIAEYCKTPVDYLSFKFPDGTPSIKSHIGLFAEVVSLRALKKVKECTEDNFYFEHVTNYIYAHPEKFSIRWVDLPAEVRDRKDIRLTIDTQNDFNNAKAIFEEWRKGKENVSLQKLVNIIDSNRSFLQVMQHEIERNTK